MQGLLKRLAIKGTNNYNRSMAYRTRILEKHILSALKEGNRVIVEGTCGTGKTTLLRKVSERPFDVRKALSNPSSALALDMDRSLPFSGKGIHGVDGLDLDYDLLPFQKGKAVYMSSRATGFDHFTLYPLSFYEEGISNGAVSLNALFSGAYEDGLTATTDFSLEDLILALSKGGFPVSLGKKTSTYPRKIYQTLLKGALSKESKTEQSPERISALLKRYASAVGTIEKNTDMLRDLRGRDPSLAESTLYDLLNALRRLLILDEIEAWYPPIKASPTIRRLSKKEFIDPSLALVFQKKGDADLRKDPLLLQRLFEGACARDLKVYSSGMGGKVKYYEDRFGLRSDLALFLKNGKYALIQCRLGENDGKASEAQLLELKKKILIHDSRDAENMIGLPSFLLVLDNSASAYRSKNGVYHCPLACLGE